MTLIRASRGWTDASRKGLVDQFLASGQMLSTFAGEHNVSSSALGEWVKTYGPDAQNTPSPELVSSTAVIIDITEAGEELTAMSEKLMTTFGFRPTPAQTVLHLIREYGA